MDVLVFGANGLLGSNVVFRCLKREIDVSGTYHMTDPTFSIELSQLDVRNHERVRTILEGRSPSHVVNCAALTDVNGCEIEPATAHEINGEAPGTLASLCAEQNIHFCHVSTDYVFGGDASSPFSESAGTRPIQVYGESKPEGERSVLEAAGSTLVTRLSFIYGKHGATGELEGFPDWVSSRLRAGETTPLFTD